MTPELRLLATLAVALAPARAPRLLGWLGLPGGAEAVRLAEALVHGSRRARLAALAAAVSVTGPATPPRPAPGAGEHKLLARLGRERRAAGRTVDRAAGGPPG